MKENVSIRNLPIIFETLADFGKVTSDTDLLAEYVRQALARQITNQYLQSNESLKVVTLSGKVEKIIADGVQQTEHGNYLAIDPIDFTKYSRINCYSKWNKFHSWNKLRLYYVHLL